MPIVGKSATTVAAGLVILVVESVSASIAASRGADPADPRVAPGSEVASARPAGRAFVDLTFEVKNLSDEGLLV